MAGIRGFDVGETLFFLPDFPRPGSFDEDKFLHKLDFILEEFHFRGSIIYCNRFSQAILSYAVMPLVQKYNRVPFKLQNIL